MPINILSQMGGVRVVFAETKDHRRTDRQTEVVYRWEWRVMYTLPFLSAYLLIGMDILFINVFFSRMLNVMNLLYTNCFIWPNSDIHDKMII